MKDKELVDEHWGYVEGVIRAEWQAFTTVMDVDARNVDEHCKVIEHHYKSAMLHGMKHGRADKHAEGAEDSKKGSPVDVSNKNIPMPKPMGKVVAQRKYGVQTFEEAGP